MKIDNFFTSHVRTSCSILVFATLVVLLAACGGTTSGSGTASSTGGTTPASSGSGYGGYGHGGAVTPTTSSSGTLIKTATVTVNGASKSVLTNTQGMTLYYRTSDAPP